MHEHAVDSDHFISLEAGGTELFVFKMPCSVEFVFSPRGSI
jgi:hypothetical protein